MSAALQAERDALSAQVQELRELAAQALRAVPRSRWNGPLLKLSWAICEHRWTAKIHHVTGHDLGAQCESCGAWTDAEASSLRFGGLEP